MSNQFQTQSYQLLQTEFYSVPWSVKHTLVLTLVFLSKDLSDFRNSVDLNHMLSSEAIQSGSLQCLPFNLWIYSKICIRQSDWLTVTRVCVGLIYSARQRLKRYNGMYMYHYLIYKCTDKWCKSKIDSFSNRQSHSGIYHTFTWIVIQIYFIAGHHFHHHAVPLATHLFSVRN